jgi:hypothetical protein
LGPRCSLYQIAVTDHEGEVRFNQPAKHLGGGSLIELELANDTFTSITVKATTLDATFTGLEPPVRLLHIDTEFSEPMVIAGAHAFIERHPEMIIVLEVLGEHFRNRGDDSLRQALAYLSETGRALCVINDNRPLQMSIDQLMQFSLVNVAAIPRHLAGVA